MTVAILGFVTAALVGVVFQYVKISSNTSARLSESTDQQFLAVYWQQDVSAMGIRDFVDGELPSATSAWTSEAGAPGSVPAGCRTALPGSVVAGFAWTEYEPSDDPTLTWTGATIDAAVYVLRDGDSGQSELIRVRCNGADSTTSVVARYLTAPPEVECAPDPDCTSVPIPETVSITVNVEDLSRDSRSGYETTLTAERRQDDLD